ncbi:ICP0-binding domain of ubiquitin-specific protease 7-domain-containing protein [Rhizophagus diaphanus]|nr:ICP0-binding domain of ubiquitin-specific protease 7-domain-containing protein [Rhizophagus diaphanus] [Rhizophagus sp. MUCL 43196]
MEDYITVKIVTAEKFKIHQGFDLANFYDRFHTLSEIYVYKILKNETFKTFKDNISRTFNISPEQVRFWLFVMRANKTFRLESPIPESYINTSMETIRCRAALGCNEMRLYMEVAKKINGKKWFPAVPNANIIIVFLKYFDPDKQALEGLGHLYVQKFGQEISPNMIEEMNPESTFQQSEIQDGDIICFQKTLTEREIQKHKTAGHCWDIPHFYELLTLRIVVSFKPKFDYFCTVKVVTAEIFKKHKGFDLVDFKNWHDLLPEAYLYKILKSETYGVFKENISRRFNIPPEQVQFWVLINRQNGTIRPNTPISELFLKTSMGEICADMNSKQNELKLYMEIADKQINGNMWFPIIGERNTNSILIFLKYFDPGSQTLKGLCHLYVQKFGKVKDYINIFREKEKLPPDTPIKIYEEIGPNEIKEMKLGSTFQQRNGDIISFQKDLTDKEHVLIQEYVKAGLIYSIPQFYESLTSSNDFLFQPKLKNLDEFELVLNKNWTYDQVAEEVATHLNTDPLKLQFTAAHSTSGTPKNVIKQTTNQTLSEMLQTAYLSPPTRVLLFYEMLKSNIVELETKKFIQVYWLGKTVKDVEAINLHLPKDAIVNDIIKEIFIKKAPSSPNAKIILYEVINNKIQKEYKGIESINEIQEFMMLYAEEISQDELLINNNLQVYHFTKDPLNTHGTPFKFFIKNDEVFADTKIRLQLRLGMNKEEFAKIRIAIVSDVMYKKPEYLNDDDIILSEKELTNMDYLGLDHIDETGQAKSADRTIYIRG